MSRRRPSGQPTATITHPQDESIKVTIRKLTRAEEIDRGDDLRKLQRAIPLFNPDGSPVLDADSNQRVHMVQSMTSEMIVKALCLCIVNWTGILDSKEIPISYDASVAGILLEDFLDVDVDGVRRAFSGYLLDKLYDGTTFDSDPLG